MVNSRNPGWGAASLYASLLISLDASALTIGDIRVKSYLGEPFRAAIGVTVDAEEKLDPSCISLDRTPSSDQIYRLSNARIAVEAQGGKQVVLISTTQKIDEPVVSLQLQVYCGSAGRIAKSFTVLLDPSNGAMPQPPETEPQIPAPAVAQVQAKAVATSEWKVKPNDTLSGIAHYYFPGQRQAQRRFVQAILKQNPGLNPRALQEGEMLRIPEVSGFHGKAIPAPKREPEQAAPLAQAQPAKPAAPASVAAKPRLNILAGEPSDKPVEAQQLKRTEAQLLSKADDQTIEILELKDQIRRLETRLSDLQNKVVVSNRQLAQLKSREAPPREKWAIYLWIAGGVAALFLLGAIAWYFFNRRKEEEPVLMDDYVATPPARPQLADHLDYFETTETHDHHRW